MQGRLQTLERIAGLARQLRDLERELIPAKEPRLVVARLKSVRRKSTRRWTICKGSSGCRL